MKTVTEIPPRRFANVFDLRVDGPACVHPCQPGGEFIGGYGGAAWYEYFLDGLTREAYRVRCYDGVNASKGSFSEEDDVWLNRCYAAVITRCHTQADGGATEVRISKNELVIMRRFMHQWWLESAPGLHDGEDSKEGLEGGLVGHCHGVPVICDLSQKDDLPVVKVLK